MRFHRLLIISLALLFCLHSVLAVPHVLVNRQDDTASSERSQASAITDADSRSSSSTTPASQTPTATTQSHRSSTLTASSSARVTISTPLQVSATTASDEPLPTSSKDASSTNSLPIHPKITPAIGILGAILLVSGVTYTVIGIKNKWLYVFFSAAYLSSLTVTVLIVYLMAPSVSDAIQGVFFVAAFLTGVIFGVLALVFSDLTDGLGCLLGSFCLSMWFLTLKEGGLITSTTGRAIFIAAMSLAGFCLSFSHHTRTYGLMASISFAGATVTVLGIDCFSRAGLKEFWLYIWNLNPDIFPLFTETYPMTKPMRAELACIVLFTVFGVISQLRLWKIVKERRVKSATSRLERDQQSAQEEEAVGRSIEDNFAKERAQWEATYGNKTLQQDSAIGSTTDSTPKTSTSVHDSIEMVPLSKASGSSQAATGPTVTITVLEEDDVQQIDNQGVPTSTNRRTSGIQSDASANRRSSDRTSSDVMSPNGLPPSFSTRSSVPPPLVPLPFTVPQEDEAQSDQYDNDSVSAVPESVRESLSHSRRFSKRLSGSALKRFSINQNSPRDFDSDEATMIIPHIEDDRSSLAATFDADDDAISLPGLSPAQSPRYSMVDEQPSIMLPTEGAKNTNGDNLDDSDAREESKEEKNTGSKHTVTIEHSASSSTQQATRQSLIISTGPRPRITPSKNSPLSSPVSRQDMDVSVNKEDDEKTRLTTPTKSRALLVTDSYTGNLQGPLPEKLSKVALSYRTNEWAKHLDAAEKPEADYAAEPASPGVRLDHGLEERPVPVSDEILQPLVGKTTPRRVSTESFVYQKNNPIRSNSNFSKSSQLEPQHSLSRTPSDLTSGGVSPSGSATHAILSPKRSNTLLEKRETLVRSRVSSQSFAPVSPNLQATPEEQESMTLAQRRQLLQQQKPPSASKQWRQSSRATQGQTQDFDSHQPKRVSSSGADANKREVLLAGWRESIRQDVGAPVQTLASPEDSRRAAMLNERRKNEMREQQREMAKQQRESMMDNMMRRDNMLDAHRDALRRMQASANKKL